MTEIDPSRRPIASRDKRWAQRFAGRLKDAGFKPNTISVFSFVFAAAGAASFIASALVAKTVLVRDLLLVGGIAGIMGRLLCNLFDGMVAIEGGLKTAAGEIFNDLPDRLSDMALIVAIGVIAGYGSQSPTLWYQLGWAAACVAVMTAYIRYLGAGMGTAHFFLGPMAKQHRMATIITATLASIATEPHAVAVGTFYRIALVVILAGATITCIRRVVRVAAAVNQK